MLFCQNVLNIWQLALLYSGSIKLLALAATILLSCKSIEILILSCYQLTALKQAVFSEDEFLVQFKNI